MNSDLHQVPAEQLAHLLRGAARVGEAHNLGAAVAELGSIALKLVPAVRCRVTVLVSGECIESVAESEPSGAVAEAADVLRVPLPVTDGTITGTIELTGALVGPFADSEARLVSELARLSAQCLDRVHLRTRLSDQGERLRLALEAASLGTWEHIPASHATYWDARSKAMFGLSVDEELAFEQFVDAIHPEDRERVLTGIGKAVDPVGPGECSLEYRIRTRLGEERWVEAHGRCVFDTERNPQRINGTLLDITERKRAEEALRESSRRKDEFLALLGHELRNPLAPIHTALDLMRRRAPEYCARERTVIERQVRHMIRLVDDLLDLARIARGTIALKTEPLELGVVVARATEMASPLFEEKRHRLDVHMEDELWVEADAVRLAQIIANLLTNAARYTPAGGHVWLRARADAGQVMLEVEDSGIGLEPEDLGRIFEPFVQSERGAKSKQGGLGLGLSLVRDLVRLHGGSVEARSPGAGRGSTFIVRLPATEKRRTPEPKLAQRTPEQAKGRVLVVDDNEDAAELLTLLLEQLGYEVTYALDGPQALEKAAEFRPETAVVDLGLPVMDGFELAARLAELLGPKLRLVALTGYGQPEDRKRTHDAGFAAHLVKPVDPHTLAAALAR